MPGDQVPLRVVIQQLRVVGTPRYRATAYGDEFKPEHRDFDTAADLKVTLSRALPGMDISLLRFTPLESGDGSIVFDDELPLSGEQLSALGLLVRS